MCARRACAQIALLIAATAPDSCAQNALNKTHVNTNANEHELFFTIRIKKQSKKMPITYLSDRLRNLLVSSGEKLTKNESDFMEKYTEDERKYIQLNEY